MSYNSLLTNLPSNQSP